MDYLHNLAYTAASIAYAHHPSGLPGAEVYEYEQKQRRIGRQIREAKRELRGAQIVHDRVPGLESRSALLKAQERLKGRQAAMRALIDEANGKARPGTEVLHRKPNREWAGDMPKGTNLKASGRKLDEFLGGAGASASLKANGISKTAARRAVAEEMARRGGTVADFAALTAGEQQAVFKASLPGATPTEEGRRVFPSIVGDHSRADDLSAANPGFSRKDDAHTKNCQRCVPTYVMRRRGYDVVAKPRLNSDDPLTGKWDRIFIGQRWYACGSTTTGRGQIEERMRRWGDGAIAEVVIAWDKESTHAFVAENIGGTIVFSDPQSGRDGVEGYFQRAIPGCTMVSRIDNLKPSALIDECCTTRKGGRS